MVLSNPALILAYFGSSLSSSNRPVLAAGKRWSWTFRPPVPSKSFAPKSVLGCSDMWQLAQLSFAFSGK